MLAWLTRYNEVLYLNDCMVLGRLLSNSVALYLVNNLRIFIVAIIWQHKLKYISKKYSNLSFTVHGVWCVWCQLFHSD